MIKIVDDALDRGNRFLTEDSFKVRVISFVIGCSARETSGIAILDSLFSAMNNGAPARITILVRNKPPTYRIQTSLPCGDPTQWTHFEVFPRFMESVREVR